MKKIYSLRFTIFLILAASSLCIAQTTYTYTGKPRFQILTTQNNATLGIIQVELFPNIAPKHVRNFDSLVSQQFYDTCAFHRVVPGFVIQGGDPNSRHGPVNTWGFGQTGQPTVMAEFSQARHERGILSAARQAGNINSATSQFFICVAPAPNLNGQYSVYGRVTSGMNVVDQIVNTPTVVGTQRPVNKVEMFVTYIGSNDTVPLPPALLNPKKDSMNVDTNVVILKWAKVNDAQFYYLEVARDSLFTDTVRTKYLTPLTYGLYPLDADTMYYWRVSANNGGHTSTSPVWRFRTVAAPKDTTSQDTSSTGIRALIFGGKRVVYPNPSGGTFIFANNVPGDVIEIYDALGRKVLQQTAKDQNHTITMKNYANGRYSYRIISGGRQVMEGHLVLDN
jgi:cyclophilin family peptidyl-prolyl cis-trans isomerase